MADCTDDAVYRQPCPASPAALLPHHRHDSPLHTGGMTGAGGTALPPWRRMRGGGGVSSSEAANSSGARKSRAAGRKGATAPRASQPAPVASPAAVPAGVLGPRRATAPPRRARVLLVDLDSVSASSSASPVSTSPTASPRPGGDTGSEYVSPDTLHLQRPVLTIFTTVPADELGGPAAAASAPIPRQPSSPSKGSKTAAAVAQGGGPQRSGSPGGVGAEKEDEKLLRATETTLMPTAHYSLFGNGLELSMLQGTAAGSFAESPRGHPHPAGSPPPLSPLMASRRLPQGSFASPASPPPAHTAVLSMPSVPLAGSLPGAPRVSATPVVPINPYNETATRRRVVQELLSKYGPEAGKYIEEFDSSVATAAAAAAASAGDADQAKATRDAGKEKPAAAAVSQPGRGSRMTREQIVRVGAMRLHQRLSTLSLTVCRVKNDGNCQFRAIAQQLLGAEEYHDLIRAHVVSYMKKVRREKFDFFFDSTTAADAYFAKIAKVGTWGDEMTLRGASDALFVNIHVLSSAEKSCYSCYQPSPDAPPAPSFLVDIAKIRERRRQERQYHRWQRQSFCGSPPQIAVGATAGQSPEGRRGGSSKSTSRHCDPSTAAAPGLADEVGDITDEDHTGSGEEEEEEMDADAIQRALQRRLQGTRIKASVPYFTPDGQLRQPRASLGMSFSAAPASYSGGGAPTTAHTQGALLSLSSPVHTPTPASSFAHASSGLGPAGSHRSRPCGEAGSPGQPGPLLIPQQGGGSSPAGNPPLAPKLKRKTASSPRAGAVPGASRTTTSKRSGAAAAVGPAKTSRSDPAASDRGACRTAESRVVDMAAFGVTADDAVSVTKYQTLRRPPARVRRPAVEAAGDVPDGGDGGGDGGGGAGGDRASSAFPIFPTVGGGNVMLLAVSPTGRHGSGGGGGAAGGADSRSYRALCQSFAALKNPTGGSFAGSFAGDGASFAFSSAAHAVSNGSMIGGSAPWGGCGTASGHHDDSEDDDDEVVFMFEPRKQPIDIFLSYLYPVHYNALCIVEEDSDAEGDRAVGGNGATQQQQQPHASGESQGHPEERPQFINASFLRASFAV